jgi:RNA polymerase sigma-70 factor, ECF subfamily
LIEKPDLEGAMEDNLIIRRIKNGDIDAFSILVEKYHRRLLAFIYRLVCDEKIVEDLGQEVFLDVYRSLKGFDISSGTPFSAWLFITARNRCISELRKRKRSASVSIDEIGHLGTGLKSAEDLLIQHEQRQAVKASLEALSEPFKGPLVMSLSGCTLKEIADACGISPGTAKSRLSRAREKMKFLISEYLGGKRYERI